MARLDRGRAAWQDLESKGGLTPLPEQRQTNWEWHFWDGMGEFDPVTVRSLIARSIPHLPDEDRCWPWIAKAVFDYKSDYQLALERFDLKTNADATVASIAKHLAGLQAALLALTDLKMHSRETLGASNWHKVWQVSQALDGELGGTANAMVPDRGIFGLQRRLVLMEQVCARFAEPVGGGRLRGGTDPSLLKLVAHLGIFWIAVTSRRPSASKPSRKDGGDGPFVRLVDGCVRLAGGPGASRKQVQRALKNMPIASASSAALGPPR